jgi:hypothetical protein
MHKAGEGYPLLAGTDSRALKHDAVLLKREACLIGFNCRHISALPLAANPKTREARAPTGEFFGEGVEAYGKR